MAGVWVARSKTDVEIGPKNQTPEFWGIQEKKGRQKGSSDARKAVWAFVRAKFIAGGPGTFLAEGKGQKAV